MDINKLSFLVLLLLFPYFNINAQNKTDASVYLCKYTFEWQRDTSNIFSKTYERMSLEIGKESSTFYSYDHFLGYQNFLADVKAKKGLDYIRMSSYRYYKQSETEIIIHNFETKQFKVIDKLAASGPVYCYSDSVEVPKWQLAKDTLTILNHLCQMATTTFKGRDYIAWFATDIPVSVGPWEYTGLPGLILRIHDKKGQISFDATEIGSGTASHAVEIEYPDCVHVEKSKLHELKKLKAENRIAFEKMQNPNLTITVTNSAGEIVQPPNKPYNPIDLSK